MNELAHMRPSDATDNMRHIGSRDTEYGGDLGMGEKSPSREVSYRAYIELCEPGVVMGLAFGVTRSPLCDHVLHVQALPPNKKVAWTNAGRVIAAVEDAGALWDVTAKQYPRDPMREMQPRPKSATSTDNTVSLPVDGSGPFPTPIRYEEFPKETLQEWLASGGNVLLLHTLNNNIPNSRRF